jgi:hypothetical protein
VVAAPPPLAPPPARVPVNGTRPAPNGRPGPGRPTNGHVTGGITPRQLNAIWKVGQAKGLDPNAVEHMSFRVFNRKPEALTQPEGAALIKELSNLNRRAGEGSRVSRGVSHRRRLKDWTLIRATRAAMTVKTLIPGGG